MKDQKTTYYPDGSIKSVFETQNGVKHGSFIGYHKNGQKSIEAHYYSGNLDGMWREIYENGQVSEEGIYKDGEYSPMNFWTENGEKTLNEGTGKVTRVFGANGNLAVEQYFEEGEFKGEKKLTDVHYGKFTKKQ